MKISLFLIFTFLITQTISSLLEYNKVDQTPGFLVSTKDLNPLSSYHVHKPLKSYSKPIEKISKLNDYIFPFINSFIVISNPLGVDIFPSFQPILLRRHLPVFRKADRNTTHNLLRLDSLLEIPVENQAKTLIVNRLQTTCVSPFFHNSTNSGGICTKINFFYFSSRSRPWNGQVNFDLDIPIIGKTTNIVIYRILVGTKNWFYERTFNYEHMQAYQRTLSQRNFHFLVLPKGESERKQLVVSWIAAILRKSESGDVSLSTNGDSFFLLETKMENNNPRKIGRLFNIKICLSCAYNYDEAVDFKRLLLKKNMLVANSNQIYDIHGENPVWEFSRDKSGSNILQSTLKTCKLPHDMSTFSGFHSAMAQLSLSDVADYAYASLVRNALMKNASHLTNCLATSTSASPVSVKQKGCGVYFTQCLTHITFTAEHFAETHSYFPWTIDFPSKMLRFISCGRPYKRFAFYQLVSVYDESTWMFIIFSMLLPAPVFLLLSKLQKRKVVVRQGSKLRYLLSPVQCILEQGDPFPAGETEQVPSFKWFMIPFLFAIIVVSNAYKNDNVYSLISPRRLIPYTKFEQLVEDEFEVYSRGFVRERESGICPSMNFTMETNHKAVACKISGGKW